MAKKAKSKIVRQLTPENKLNSLLKSARSCAKQVNEITGSHREKIATAVEKDHLHKGAFAVVKRLDNMEPQDIAAFLDHFHHYLDVSGIQKRADDAPGLDLDGEDDDDAKKKNGEGEAEAARAGNVVRPGRFSDNKDQAHAGGTPG